MRLYLFVILLFCGFVSVILLSVFLMVYFSLPLLSFVVFQFYLRPFIDGLCYRFTPLQSYSSLRICHINKSEKY